jgi:hypothetical protein
LDEERDLILPWSLSRNVSDLDLQLGDLSGKVFKSGEILADADLLDRGNGEDLPPGKIGEGEGIAIRGGEVVA